jgi:hypothetical protein
MLVKLNAYRGENRPGDIIDIDDANAATLITHGAAFPADDIDAELDKTQTGARTVRGAAALQAASSSAATDQAPAP